jgi:uncharacterized protein (TIGR00369 family)
MTQELSPTQTRIQAVHENCFACGKCNALGLSLRFSPEADGAVGATFQPEAHLQGYPDVLHGGVISALLDSAMTHSLFARSVTAVTAELKVRFRHPVTLDEPVVLLARVTRASEPLFVAEAELWQGEQLRATAEGKFMHAPQWTPDHDT